MSRSTRERLRTWIVGAMTVLMFAELSSAAPEAVSADTTTPSSGDVLPRYQARFDRIRPVIAVVGYNKSTELTDYIVPYGILAESKALLQRGSPRLRRALQTPGRSAHLIGCTPNDRHALPQRKRTG